MAIGFRCGGRSRDGVSGRPGIRPRRVWLVTGLALSLTAAAQTVEQSPAEAARDAAVRAEAFEPAPPPPPRPQVPFAEDIPEVTTYGPRLPFGLPDSVREEIWDSQRRQLDALLLERERMENVIARDGLDALFGSRVSLLPGYDPTRERKIDYGVNDSQPASVINLFGVGFGGKKPDRD